jgi:SAM-dependent methyltransferase
VTLRSLDHHAQVDYRPVAGEVVCGCCGSTCELIYSAHPGYRLATAYDLYHCRVCDTSQASPLTVDVEVYDAIYAQIEKIPGYERYVGYARSLPTERCALDHLASLEDVYWAIREQLRSRPEKPQELRVLDAGSGQGHLAYALARAGYDVHGVDVSEVAVAQATTRFGELFEHADVREFARTRRATFDVVTMTEVIEHVPNVSALVSSVLELLRPGGELLVTTPNKTSFAANAVWGTENPPVHLWWFSENSMTALGGRLGSDVRFVDFGKFNLAEGASDRFIEGRRQRELPFFPPVLDASSRVTRPARSVRSARGAVRLALDYLHLSDAFLMARHRLYVRRYGVSSRRPNMCAVFSKPS